MRVREFFDAEEKFCNSIRSEGMRQSAVCVIFEGCYYGGNQVAKGAIHELLKIESLKLYLIKLNN